MSKHWADKPLLRDFFWFLVLPYQFRQWRTVNGDERRG